MMLTAKDPAGRSATAGEVADQSRRLRDNLVSGAIGPRPVYADARLTITDAPVSQARGAVRSRTRTGRSHPQRTLGAAAVAALAALTCLVLLTVTGLASSSHPDAPPSSGPPGDAVDGQVAVNGIPAGSPTRWPAAFRPPERQYRRRRSGQAHPRPAPRRPARPAPPQEPPQPREPPPPRKRPRSWQHPWPRERSGTRPREQLGYTRCRSNSGVAGWPVVPAGHGIDDGGPFHRAGPGQGKCCCACRAGPGNARTEADRPGARGQVRTSDFSEVSHD